MSDTINNIVAAVTHGGNAHRDEFMALATLMGFLGKVVPVYRREPTEAELLDPCVAVVDIGMQLDPALNNYDHHQYRKGDSAFTLLLKRCGVYEGAAALYPWVDFSNTLDTSGPLATARHYGIPDPAFEATKSPIEEHLLQMFATMEVVTEPMLSLMYALGTEILEGIRLTAERLQLLATQADIRTIGGVKVVMVGIDDRPSFALDEFRKRYHPDLAISVYRDSRGSGLTFYRFADHPQVDFYRLAQDERISFAHKDGFVAKTSQQLSAEELTSLLALAIAASQ